MTEQEAKILAEYFDTPCNFSPIDEYMFDHSGSWCRENCHVCGDTEQWKCWIRWMKLMLGETE